MRNLLSAAAIFLSLVLFASTPGRADAAAGPFAADGWYTWRVAAVDDAPR